MGRLGRPMSDSVNDEPYKIFPLSTIGSPDFDLLSSMGENSMV